MTACRGRGGQGNRPTPLEASLPVRASVERVEQGWSSHSETFRRCARSQRPPTCSSPSNLAWVRSHHSLSALLPRELDLDTVWLSLRLSDSSRTAKRRWEGVGDERGERFHRMERNTATTAWGWLGWVEMDTETLDQVMDEVADLPRLCGRHADLAIFSPSTIPPDSPFSLIPCRILLVAPLA